MRKAFQCAAIFLAAFLILPTATSAKKLSDTELLARIVYLEARGENDEGQQAVAQVVINRVESGKWGKTFRKVIYAPGQFTPAHRIEKTKPTAKEYENVQAVLEAESPILPEWVMYFQGAPRKDYGYINHVAIGEHYFGGYKQDKDGGMNK